MKIGKKELLLEYLKQYSSITSYEAFVNLYDTRLSDTIYRLKKDGYKFKTENIEKIGYKGIKRNFYKYTLIDEEVEKCS